MSRSIKVSDDLYEKLLDLMRPRDTFADVIRRALKVYEVIFEIQQTLGPGHYLAQRPEGDKEAAAASKR